MGLGILEAQAGHVTPGTVVLFDDDHVLHNHAGVKVASDGITILVPQPSNDPADPLNWPLWKKEVLLWTLVYSIALIESTWPTLSSSTTILAVQFDASIQDIAFLTAWENLIAGCLCMFVSALSRLYGKRAVLLLSMIIFLAGNIWAACASSYEGIRGSRILMGTGTPAFECLVSASISEIYFLHERGKRLSLYVVAFYVGIYLSPILGAQVVSHPRLGWNWTFGFTALFAGIAVILIFLFIPETQYQRRHMVPTASNESTLGVKMTTEAMDAKKADKLEESVDEIEDSEARGTKSRSSFISSLSLWSGRHSRENPIVLFFKPVVLLLTNPAVLWATLIAGVGSTWTSGPAFILAEYFTAPPYNFTIEQVGYLWFAPFIGCFIAFFSGGLLNDWAAKRITRLNNNVYEPEFRFFLAIPTLVTAIIGFVGFGWALQNDAPWIAPCLTFAFQLGSVIYANIMASAYIGDGWREQATEVFVIMYSFKNFFAFGLSYFFFPWLALDGLKITFIGMGVIVIGLCLLTVPLYIFGKKIRDFYNTHNVLRTLRME